MTVVKISRRMMVALTSTGTYEPADDEVAMTALDNPMTPPESVVPLLSHPSPQVRGHALLAHIRNRLPDIGEAELNAILDAHRGDEGVSLGVRHLIAASPGVPRSVLVRLASDDADFIAECARARLAR